MALGAVLDGWWNGKERQLFEKLGLTYSPKKLFSRLVVANLRNETISLKRFVDVLGNPRARRRDTALLAILIIIVFELESVPALPEMLLETGQTPPLQPFILVYERVVQLLQIRAARATTEEICGRQTTESTTELEFLAGHFDSTLDTERRLREVPQTRLRERRGILLLSIGGLVLLLVTALFWGPDHFLCPQQEVPPTESHKPPSTPPVSSTGSHENNASTKRSQTTKAQADSSQRQPKTARLKNSTKKPAKKNRYRSNPTIRVTPKGR